ncbi:hypothetical protein CDL15_Pgr024833 [Punica granatum]|uniref:Uncharacterized protein n=1 Tax=Punica granatum TaxID=22663 RepID=A0A218WKL3_PUNGR|nr:hypothetical protein CDL15_Pgr024833 [Punica granatum]
MPRGGSLARRPRPRTVSPGRPWDLRPGFSQCSLNVLRCSGIVVRRSGIVVISVFRGRAPKARRETFVTTGTSLGKPSRVPEGHLRLFLRPWWSLGACRPVSECRLLVSGSGPGSSATKGVSERSGYPSSCGLPRKCVRTCHWSLWH